MMTKAEVLELFREEILPNIRQSEATSHPPGHPDYPMRCEAWNNLTDMLCKEGRIFTRSYDTWVHPSICNRKGV